VAITLNSQASWARTIRVITALTVQMIFRNFFADNKVHQSTSTTPKQDIPTTASHSMDAWAPVTASEVEKVIGDAPNNTCNLDPAPTWLIKEFCRLLSRRSSP